MAPKVFAKEDFCTDIKVPDIYRFIIKFITPLLLLWVFIGSLVTPKDGDWGAALRGDWVLDNGSIIKKLMNSGLKEQLAAATDPAVIEQLQDTLFFVNASRLLLLAVWLSLALLVYMAYKKRVREGRI